uniref:hypothetical protein n=1 Tax=Roseivirga sp. TaxID=1964215 RepID=UPI00404869C1
MKNRNSQYKSIRMIFLIFTFLFGALLGQSIAAQTGTANKVKMEKLSDWIGKWEGEGWMIDQARQMIQFKVEENIQSKLDGMAILAEGLGTNKADGVIGFQSLGLLYFNNEKKSYEMKSLLKEGNMTLASANFNDLGEFVWGFEVKGGKVQYTLALTETTWNEKGEFIMDNGQAYQIMEMNLVKVKK